MPQIIIKQPNKRLAIFSTIVDEFILFNAAPGEILGYYVYRFGEDCRERIKRKLADMEADDYCGYYTFDDAIRAMESQHGKELADKWRSGGEEHPTYKRDMWTVIADLWEENENQISFWTAHVDMTDCRDCWTDRRPNEHVQRWTPEEEFEQGQTVWVWTKEHQDVFCSKINHISDFWGISTEKAGFFKPEHVFPTAQAAYDYAAKRWAEAGTVLYYVSGYSEDEDDYDCDDEDDDYDGEPKPKPEPKLFSEYLISRGHVEIFPFGVKGKPMYKEFGEFVKDYPDKHWRATCVIGDRLSFITSSLSRALAWIEERMKNEKG